MFDHFPFALQKTRKVTTKNANTQVNEHFYEKLIDIKSIYTNTLGAFLKYKKSGKVSYYASFSTMHTKIVYVYQALIDRRGVLKIHSIDL